MDQKSLERLIGKHVKIVTKEPSEQKTHVMTGVVTEIDNDAVFLIIETPQGTAVLNIQAIIAIKPKQRQLKKSLLLTATENTARSEATA